MKKRDSPQRTQSTQRKDKDWVLRMNRFSFFLCILCVLCGENSFALGEDGAELMAQLQTRLLNARRVLIEGDVQSRGAVLSQLRGGVRIIERNQLSVRYNGQFASKPAALLLVADGRLQELQNGAEKRREAVQDEANRAMLIGLLRMGLLHNLARLTGLQGPDHAAGGVERWVTLDNFRPTTYILGGEMEGALSFGFDVMVDGALAGSARLWLDPVSGLPRRREQTVNFRSGEMTVVENYARFVVE